MEPSQLQSVEVQLRDQHAATYWADYRRNKGRWWDELECRLLIRGVRARPGMTVVDAGAGVGRLSTALAARGCHVIALDFSTGSLRVLKRTQPSWQGLIWPLAATLTQPLPLRDDSADAIVADQVVQHIPTLEARVGAWRHLAAIARPDCILAAVVYRAGSTIPNEGYFENGLFYHRYTPREIAAELRRSGWWVMRVSSWYRLGWPGQAAQFAGPVEAMAARLHLLDKFATYLLAIARRA